MRNFEYDVILCTGNMFWIKQQKNSQEFFSAAETVSGCAFHAQGENL